MHRLSDFAFGGQPIFQLMTGREVALSCAEVGRLRDQLTHLRKRDHTF